MIIILQECKRLLSFAGLGIDETINIGGRKIPRLLPRAALFLVIVLLSVPQIINAVHYYFIDLQSFLYAVGCFLFYVIKTAMYTALLTKTNEIAELIEYLQTVVTQRNVSRFLG